MNVRTDRQTDRIHVYHVAMWGLTQAPLNKTALLLYANISYYYVLLHVVTIYKYLDIQLLYM